MAKLIQNQITITVSKIGRDDDDDNQTLVSDTVMTTLEEVTAELIGEGFIVEVRA